MVAVLEEGVTYLHSGAFVDGDHRYSLYRSWSTGARSVCWVMLNPSTADADEDDPTIRKCVGFSKQWGFGSIDVVNLYSFRSKSPKALKAAGFPNGPFADSAIRSVLGEYVDRVVCAWGTHARPDRVAEVLAMIKESGHEMRAVRMTKAGHPGHPLYVPYSAELLVLGARS